MPKHSLSGDGFLFRFSLLSFLFIILTNQLFILPYFEKVPAEVRNNEQPETASVDEEGDALGWWGSQKPVIYISGGNNKYSAGGLIPLASTDSPVVDINAYYRSDTAKITAKFELYEANREALYSYLIYKDENSQVNTDIDTSGFNLVTAFEKEIQSANQVHLPLKDSGIYLLRLSFQDIVVNSYIVRSNIASVFKPSGDEFVFWSQDYRSKRSLTSGNVYIYNFKDKATQLSNVSINNDGIARARLTAEADVAFVVQDNETAVVPINLRYLNTGYNWDRFQDFKVNQRNFNFTDRPLYRPGDTVYFKSIIRDDNDARYTIPTGGVEVVLSSYGQETPVYEQTHTISQSGSVSGEIKLPDNLKTGEYQLKINYNYIDWESWEEIVDVTVQEFRKPEYFLELETDKREFVAGDNANITVKGQYFSGQPLSNVKVNYKIQSSNYYDYEFYDYVGRQISDDYRYGWWGGKEVYSGLVDLDSYGQAIIPIDTSLNDDGMPKVFSIEVRYQDVSSDQAFDRKNILVYPGEYGIYLKSYQWSVKAGDEFTQVLKLNAHNPGTKLEVQKLKVTIEGEVYEEGKRNYYERKYEKVLDKEITTNALGEATVSFTPGKEGNYNFTVVATDVRGNKFNKKFSIYATDKNYARYTSDSEGKLSLTPDRSIYEPGDVARVVLYSAIPNRDVFLSFDRGSLNRYQVVRMQGNTSILDLPIVTTDMPNIFLSASSFSNSKFENISERLKVSAERMRLQVDISTDANKYKPGDTAVVDINIKDINGNPVSAETTVWAVDKAIYELTDNKLRNIYDAFWKERGNNTQLGHSLEGIMVQTAEGGGCFADGTKILMGDSTLKNIEDVLPGDVILTRESLSNSKLVKAKVTQTTKNSVSGHLLINGRLKITDNHILPVNGTWKEAAEIRTGDILTTQNDKEVVTSVEWQLGKIDVYNLEIEKYHTFFADGIYVHNQKGGAPREVLEDTAYWNPSVWTGTDGHARITIKLPDNLTTWALSAVASTWDTRVGQQKAEIVVSKDTIIRPIIPNVLREGDEIILSALAQNYTDSDKTFNIKLEFAEGEAEEAEKENVFIESQATQQVFWKVKPTQVKDEADLRFVMYEVGNESVGDNLLRKLPVVRFGFREVAGFAGNGDKDYKIRLHSDSQNEDTKITLNLSPTLLGSLPASMNYLIDYPYGCIEQTTSRFVPSVIVKKNQSLFPDLVRQKDIDAIINKGIARLSSLQNRDGSWGWWYGGEDAYITAYVVEYLLQAKELGYEVENSMLDRVSNYLENLQATDEYKTIPRYYALTLLDSHKNPKHMEVTSNTDDYLLGMLIIANKKNGVNDNNANGYNELVKRARYQGEAAYWDRTGNTYYFGSIDAATAMAIRAILEVGGDRNLAVKAVNYLSRSRNNHYWTNTFATAQSIRAITELSVTGDEQNPNYSYEVTVDGKRLSSGRVTSARQQIKEINVPAKDITAGGTTIKLTKNGTGQMYSTLVVEEFRTDRNFEPVGKALKVTRQIVNDKDRYRSLGVGEVARIDLRIEGLEGNSNYLVVEDTLPAGLVPVIESFRNEQAGSNYYSGVNYYTSWGTEYKADGVVFSRSHGYSSSDVMSYKARVVNSGEFWIPPATVELMYTPEINGQSTVGYISIENEAKELPRPPVVYSPRETLNKVKAGVARMGARGVLVIILVIAAVFIAAKRVGLVDKIGKKYGPKVYLMISRIKAKLQKSDAIPQEPNDPTDETEEMKSEDRVGDNVPADNSISEKDAASDEHTD